MWSIFPHIDKEIKVEVTSEERKEGQHRDREVEDTKY